MNTLNDKAMRFWKDIASEDPSKMSVKLNAINDMTKYDAEFLSNFIRENCAVNCCMLDLGSGTGLVLDKISEPVQLITAVEPFVEFSSHIESKPYLEIINASIQDFVPTRKYNLITSFGVMHFFPGDEAGIVYKKYANYLANGGYIIIKNQFALESDVLVDGYSEQLKKNYHAQYRTLEHEQALLAAAGLKVITAHDIYPPECNRWDNTRYYALIAQKAD